MSKQITYGEASREAILRGIDSLANAVKVTLGPRGRNVMIGSSYGSPTLTKDGVTVAREIDLTDPLENIGAQMVKEAASKTSDVAGDGRPPRPCCSRSPPRGRPAWRPPSPDVGVR